MAKRESLVSSGTVIERTSHKAPAMIDQTLFHYQLECSRTSATIYLGGRDCSPHHLAGISKLIGNLPRSTRVLRVDIHGISSMDLQSLMHLRGMMASWRTERDANVRLVLRAPLPREEWPTSAIQFERAPLRLVATLRKAELLEMAHHRDRATTANRLRTGRSLAPLRLCGTSEGAR
jgi:hypothetical protein